VPQKERIARLAQKPPKKENDNMKRKSSLHSTLSETQSPASKRKAIDDRETEAVGRHSFLRKIGIAGASLASVLAVLVTSSAMADGIIVTFKGGSA